MSTAIPAPSDPPAYRPFDQPRHLGDPPWSGDALAAWESAHGHDARLKCYPEYGCQAIDAERDWLEGEVARLRAALAKIAAREVDAPAGYEGYRHGEALGMAALARDTLQP